MSDSPIAPTLHLNGSSPESLRAALCDACEALRAAEVALVTAAPNARDYYPQGEHAYAQADREHRTRIERVNAVRAELHAVLDLIQDQIDARESR